MKIVNIIGGLGNQMFQYAFALSLQKKFPKEEILIDISHFNYIFIKKWGASNLHNGYEIGKVFTQANLLKKANALQLMKLTWYMPNYLLSRVIRRVLPKRKTEYIQSTKEIFEYKEEPFSFKGDMYYEGVWESIKYLEPAKTEIQTAFAHPKPNRINENYIKLLESNDSVGLHIRRGDYLKHTAFAGVCEIDYYTKAIREILKDGQKHVFYIFSNDMLWCENNIKPLIGENEICFVRENTGNNSCWDMFLMTHCKDLIIANSSFSWWGAFLNKRGGRIIAPQKWMNRDAKFEIWSSDWIRL